MSLWWTSPADRWLDGVPVGNGRVGGMWFGDGSHATIALNDETFFSAGPHHRDLTGARDALTEVRRLLRAGEPQAAQLIAGTLLGTPDEMAAFQPLAEVHVRADLEGDSVGFRRALDLEDGVAKLTHIREGGALEQELVALREPSVLILRSNATSDLHVHLAGAFVDSVDRIDDRTLVARGQWREGAKQDRPLLAGSYRLTESDLGRSLQFAVAIRVVEGRDVSEDRELCIAKGQSAIAITTATDLDGNDPSGLCLAALDALHGPAEAIERGMDWHRKVMRRAGVEIDDPHASRLQSVPTDLRLAALRAGGVDDGLLIELADYGRYLLVASSLGGDLPPNLQGIWNADVEPAWSSRWTLNINLQMNLWAAGPWNLPEVGDQLASFTESLAASGHVTAREIYGSSGWVVHHNTDVWRATEPTTMVEVGIFPGATAWLCDQLWSMYRYSQSQQRLARLAPLLFGALDFVKDWLVSDDTGQLVTSPSSTPENSYLLSGAEWPLDVGTDLDHHRYGWLCESPTLDIWLVRALIDACIAIVELLPETDVDVGALSEMRAKLRPIPIRNSTISEWTSDERPREIGHRHLSPLYGIYPGTIDVRAEPDIAAAAIATLLERQSHVHSSANGWGGWSRVWAGCLWARLGDGERAYESIAQWSRSTVSPASLLCVFPEFDGQPADDAIFQIDANLGLPAVVAEMLVQGHTGRIHLLPALPARWRSGRFHGLKVHGGHLVDAEWAAGRLTSATIHPAADCQLTVLVTTDQLFQKSYAANAGVPLTISFPATRV